MTDVSSTAAGPNGSSEDFFTKYMTEGFDKIAGWPGNKPSVAFNIIFRKLLAECDGRGGACEIGVHHGKYLIALHNLFEDRRSLGIDLFARQELNIDVSGRGDREICERNIALHARNPGLITLMAADSLSMSDSDIAKIINDYGRFSIFSIDGGHTKLHISIDLVNAAKLTAESGIIIVDDIFHPDWPEVTEGVYRAILGLRTPFVPFLLTRKKLYLCNASLQAKYARYSAENGRGKPLKMVTFAGWAVPSINFGSEY